jgi:Gas vesicle synthesis protein GvpL/GvpF
MSKSQAVASAQPRIYPTARAVLLFGAGPAELATRRFAVEGRRIQGLRFRRLTLLVSYVDQIAYAPEELERRRNDVEFLRAEARVHERIVERAGAHGAPVAPVRLLSAFAGPELLEEFASAHYARWCRALPRVGDKRELVVHAFAGPHAAPDRAPYLLRVTPFVTRTPRAWQPKCEQRFMDHVGAIAGACSEAALATRRIVLPSRRGALYSAAYLVDEPGAERVRVALADHQTAGAALGITMYLEGPRPPFSFCA